MRWLFLVLLMVVVTIALEALYRWTNGLVLDSNWLGYRVVLLAVLFSVQGWVSRREVRRERRLGKFNDGVLLPILATLLGAGGLVVWVWRTIDALRTGRAIASTMPETYTTWSANPSGFAMALGMGLLGVLIYLFVLVGGFLLLRQSVVRRRGRPELDESMEFGS